MIQLFFINTQKVDPATKVTMNLDFSSLVATQAITTNKEAIRIQELLKVCAYLPVGVVAFLHVCLSSTCCEVLLASTTTSRVVTIWI